MRGARGERAHPDHITVVDATVGRGFVDVDRLGDREPFNIGQTEQFRRARRDVVCTTELFRIAQMVVAPGPLSALGQEHS